MANAGTPLMVMTGLHLLAGNALLGLFEGLLLASLFHTPKARSVFVLIAANYFSAWMGLMLALPRLSSVSDMTIENIRMWSLFLLVVAFLATILFELPFFWLLLRKKLGGWRTTLQAVLIIHGASYLGLVVVYWMASGTSMMTKLEVVPADELWPGEPYHLYYISPEGDRLLEWKSEELPEVFHAELDGVGRNDRLSIRSNTSGGADLYLDRASISVEEDQGRLIAADFFNGVAPDAFSHAEPVNGQSGFTRGMWPVASLLPDSQWKLKVGIYPVEGISGRHEEEGREWHYALETLFAPWAVRNATQISERQVVFQLGPDQIVLLDWLDQEIALLARGQGPVVVRGEAVGYR